ncbi:hypothetical protein GGS20DRAFT_582202 [Poronia punctata]|nr:hypothetical protein GGS20DRAFT_582202 [Poronia punctata]
MARDLTQEQPHSTSDDDWKPGKQEWLILGTLSAISLIVATFPLLAWGFGSVIGPLAGGLIVHYTTRRWIFYINFPFCAIGRLLDPFTVKIRPATSLSFRESLLRVDWPGAVSFIGSLSSLLMGLTWGGVQFPWTSFESWLPILLGRVGVTVPVSAPTYTNQVNTETPI